MVHPVDWRLGLSDLLPSLAQVDGFVTDYELARGEPFDDAHDEVLAAAPGVDRELRRPIATLRHLERAPVGAGS